MLASRSACEQEDIAVRSLHFSFDPANQGDNKDGLAGL